MNNIESFNIAIAETFGQCYQSFPVRVDISVVDLGAAIRRAQGDESSDIDMRQEEYEIARESVKWLIDAGYLWHRNATNMDFRSVTLAPKALEVLNVVPDGLQGQQTLGEQLSKGIKEIGKDAALSIVKTSLSHGVSLVLGA
jgi:hypothetical protein